MGLNVKDFAPAPIFQATQRGAANYKELIANNEIQNGAEDQAFESYALREGEIIMFPDFKSQKDEAGNPDSLLNHAERIHPTATATGWMWIVPCLSTYKGKTKSTWFNVSSFKRQDADRNPMHPAWYALGNLENRVNMLEKMGQITGLKAETFQVVTEFVTDNNGRLRPATKEDGTFKTGKRDEVMVTEPLAE